MKKRVFKPDSSRIITIKEAFERFQKHNRVKNLSPDTIDYYEKKIRSFFEFLGGTERPVSTVTEDGLEDYVLMWQEERDVAAITINMMLRAVRVFLWKMHWLPASTSDCAV